MSKTWNQIYFGGHKFSNNFLIAPYRYKMIRGIDFYTHYLERMGRYSNVTCAQEKVLEVVDMGNGAKVITGKQQYTAKAVFNSIFDYKKAKAQHKYPVLQQHFIGWFIKTKEAVFKEDIATFMDFSIPQKGNTRFMYVLPFSENEGLVEYTLFSETLLEKEEYENAIEAYIRDDLGCLEYEILDREQGSIPMTCYPFSENNTPHILHIGMAGGWAKPSTGYTFRNSAKKVPKVVEHLKSGKALDQLDFKDRFWFYDLLLLDILHKNNRLGQPIFESLFLKRKPQEILKFLDEESTIWQDMKLMGAPAPMTFIKALFNIIF
ncbi:MAG: lycopene cyclase [Flavobacteriales bacterium]|nr:MAG: lycopene cyclase [Flavobacteriales bacterium]